MIKQYSIYVYILLIALIIALSVILLKRILGFSRHVDSLKPQFKSISDNLDATSSKIERIRESKDSYSFLLALLTIFGLAKDVRKNRKKDLSLAASINRAAMKNSSKLKNIKL